MLPHDGSPNAAGCLDLAMSVAAVSITMTSITFAALQRAQSYSNHDGNHDGELWHVDENHDSVEELTK